MTQRNRYLNAGPTSHPADTWPRCAIALLSICILFAVVSISPVLAQAPKTQTGKPAPPKPSQPPATTPALEPAEKVITGLAAAQDKIAKQITAAEQSIDQQKTDDTVLSTIRTKLGQIQTDIEKQQARAAPQLKAIRDQISKLGRKPAPNAPPETKSITDERQRLAGLEAQYQAVVRSLALSKTRTSQLVRRIIALRQGIFTTRLLHRETSPLNPSFWRAVAAQNATVSKTIGELWRTIQMAANRHWWQVILFATIALLLAALLPLFNKYQLERLTPPIANRPPFYKRATAALATLPILSLPPAILVGIGILAAIRVDIIPPNLHAWAGTLFGAIMIFLLARTLSISVLTPTRPQWRLFNLSSEYAARLVMLVQATALIFGLDLMLRGLITALELPVPVSLGLRAIANSIVALLLIAIVYVPLVTTDSAATPRSLFRPRWFKLPLLALAIIVILSTLAGYLSLGHFLLNQLLLFTGGITLAVILHWMVRSYVVRQSSPEENQPVAQGESLDQTAPSRRRRLITKLLITFADIVLFLAAVPIVLLTWGFSTADIQTGISAALFGFKIGQVNISLARIVLAIAIFVGVIAATRIVQRGLTKLIRETTASSDGVANSVQTFVGYVGTAIAALIGLSYAGFDITNVAIVAGALSVGIGFGLQSIVNNFVSGLILLFERPVKVGDWVIVNGNEGYIRKISVRATEIETFDRSSIIIPNSEFITAAVTNWTHRNAMGRGIIKVGVSYGSDPEQVRKILLDIAAGSTNVLAHPAPFVVFEDFGTSSLDFSLRVYLADVTSRLGALTELRMEIYKSFKEAGIEIPFPQSDIHIRDLDPVRAALTKAAIARAGSDQGGEEQS